MDAKIQQLTEAIYNEGVQKAKQEAGAIVQAATEKAAKIEQDAEKAAQKLINDARQKSDELKRHVDAEIRMTVNQAVSAMKQEITRLVSTNTIQPAVKELFSDQTYLQSLISLVVKGWLDKEHFDLNVILPEADRQRMEQFFKNNLAAELNKGVSINFDNKLKSGFKVGPADGSYLISFTDEEFTNFLKAYLRPKTAQILFEETT